MSIFLYIVYTVLNLFLLGWGIHTWIRTRHLSALLIVAVTFGLVYDNLMLSIGNWLVGSSWFYPLSVPRFLLHQLVLPWLILASFEQVRRSGQAWAQNRQVRWGIVVLCLTVMGLGIITRLLPMDLQLVVMDGVHRFVDEAAAGPPVVSIVSIGFAGVMGFLLWRERRWGWVLLTAVLVFIGEGMPIEMVRRIVGSGAEVLFMIALLATEQWVNTVQFSKPALA